MDEGKFQELMAEMQKQNMAIARLSVWMVHIQHQLNSMATKVLGGVPETLPLRGGSRLDMITGEVSNVIWDPMARVYYLDSHKALPLQMPMTPMHIMPVGGPPTPGGSDGGGE